MPRVVVACIAGAFVWVVWDFIKRDRSLDFTTTHVYWASFRLAISIPVAFVVPSLWGPESRLFVAFLLGIFPTDELMKMLRRLGEQKLNLGSPPEDVPTKLENLPSVDTTAADRIREEGIMTIPQLANIDPISLTIRTGYRFGFAMDCICEAVAWCYLEKSAMPALQTHGLRGAMEVFGLIAELDYKDNPQDPKNGQYVADRALANFTLGAVAEKLNMDKQVLDRILRSIAADSRVTFFSNLSDAIADVRLGKRAEWKIIAEASQEEIRRLQGSWQLKSGKENGQPFSPDTGFMKITGQGEADLKISDRTSIQAKVGVNPMEKPKTIDFTITAGSDIGKSRLGIYEIDGDTLRLCFAAVGKDRPLDFTATQNSETILGTWKREAQ